MMKNSSTRSAMGSLLVGLMIVVGLTAWPAMVRSEGTQAPVKVEKRVAKDPAKIQRIVEGLIQRAKVQHRVLSAWRRKMRTAKAEARIKHPARHTNRLASVVQPQ